MVVERSLNTLNATITDTRSRVAALEKRKAGGAGVKIHVGPDYRGDGPHISVPAIPNPDVLINHAVRPDPILGVTVYKQEGTALYKYDFSSNEWTQHEHGGPDVPTFNGISNVALNGWCGWGNNGKYVVNIRTKQHYRVNFTAAGINSLAGGRYGIFTGGGNPNIFDVLNPLKEGDKYLPLSSNYEYTRAFGVNNCFLLSNEYRNSKSYVVLNILHGGVFAKVDSWEWTANHESKYNRGGLKLTAQGNIIAPKKTVPQGQNKTDLISGNDGRFLGSPPGDPKPLENGYFFVQPNLIYNSQFSSPVAVGGSLSPRNIWKHGFITVDQRLLLFWNLDGSLNRTVTVPNKVIIDFDI